jgi:CHAD domain-containing protein
VKSDTSLTLYNSAPVSEILWSLRARSLARARKALLGEAPEGLHDFRVALRRAEATAAALGKKKIERKARSLVRSLSPLRQLEVDRHLLSRLRELGHLSENVAAGLDARWGAEYSEGLEDAARVARSGKRRRLEKKLRLQARRPQDDVPLRLEIERRRVERRLVPPPEDATDRQLHRYRIAVKRARYLAEDLAACGVPGLESRIAREKELQDALGRWNDIHLFRERLKETREESEARGSVSLVLELDHLIAALEGTVASARREALAVAGRFARVIPFLERSA